MQVYYLHLIHGDYHVVELIHDVSNNDSARGLATMIQVIAPIMDATLAALVGSLPDDREWRVDSVRLPNRKGGRQPKDSAATVFRLGDDGPKKGLLE